MSKPILYGPTYSTFVRSARMAMEEKGVDYDLVEVDFLTGPMPAEQIERHPFAKVPAFEHNDFKLYEVCAIGRYVDEAFDGPPLQPENVKERARMTQIISILDSYTYPRVVGDLVIQRLVMPMLGNDADEAVISAALPEIAKNMNTLEELCAGNTFLVSDQLTLADLHLVPIFDYFQSTPESEAIMENNPGLQAWWNTIKDRDCVKNTPFSAE
jgi:glutathione S-transferase